MALQEEREKPLLGYYRDQGATQRIEGDFQLLDPDQNPPIRGHDTISKVLFVKNEHDETMELQPETKDPDLKITQYPRMLQPKQIGPVELTFSPSIKRTNSLRAGWDFKLIVGI